MPLLQALLLRVPLLQALLLQVLLLQALLLRVLPLLLQVLLPAQPELRCRHMLQDLPLPWYLQVKLLISSSLLNFLPFIFIQL